MTNFATFPEEPLDGGIFLAEGPGLMPALLLPTEVEVGQSIQQALDDMNRRASLRADLARHLEFCPQCEAGVGSPVPAFCPVADELMRAALQ